MTAAGWRTGCIGDAFEIQQGKAISRRAREGGQQRPFLRTSNVLWGTVDLSGLDTMAFSDAEFQRFSVRAGDLFVCEGGDIGRAAIYYGPSGACSYQNHLHRLRPRTADVEPSFAMHWLRAAFTLLNLFAGAGNRTTIPNLSASRLAALDLPLPPLAEQRRIAGFLTKLQRRVEIEQERARALAALKAATLAKLFREGLRGEPLKDSPIGPIPQSWGVVPFSEVARPRGGQVDPTEAQFGAFALVGPEHIEPETGRLLAHGSAAEAGVISGKYAFESGDVLYSKIRPYLRKVVVASGCGLCSADVYALEPAAGVSGLYLQALCLSESFSEQAVGEQQRTGIPKINREQLAAILVPAPPPEHRHFTERAWAALCASHSCCATASGLQADLFAACLERLMTGETRLPEAAEAAGALDA